MSTDRPALHFGTFRKSSTYHLGLYLNIHDLASPAISQITAVLLDMFASFHGLVVRFLAISTLREHLDPE